MSEFAFELELCAALEERREGIVARQLGASVANPGSRIQDVVLVEPGPAFDARLELAGEAIPDAAIESDVGPGRYRYWKRAFGCHPDRARRATERALEIGFFESRRRNGREYVRQVARYPDWYGRLVGIENKPDLATPGDLEAQLRTDVSLGLLDEVILATESYVTRAHLHRLPDEVGVWRVDRNGGESQGGALEIDVIREPTPLSSATAGIEPLEYHPGRTDVAVVSAAEKARARRRLAERAYGKGWRTYGIPACGACEPTDADSSGATLPYCAWKGRVVDAESECGDSCGGYEPLEVDGAESEIDDAGVDLEREREARTPWVADPAGKRRRQSGLDRFG